MDKRLKPNDSIVDAYAAGFFDGEGCITTSGTSGFRLTVSNTQKEILEWLRLNYGGLINNQHLPSNPRHSIAWKWVVCRKQDVGRVLVRMRPYLLLKANEADIVLNFLCRFPESWKGRRRPEDEKLAYKLAVANVRSLKQSKHPNRG